MTELADLIRGWLAAEPSRKVPDLARASGVNKNTIYAILNRKHPKEPPRRNTLEGLARAMAPVTYAQIHDAAYRDAGTRIDQVEVEPGVQAHVERLYEMSPLQLKAAIAAAEAAADALEGL